MRFGFLFLLAVVVLHGCTRVHEQALTLPKRSTQVEKPKHVILVIGDGFALSQASASLVWNRNQTWLETFEVVGFHKPYASDDLITDSAAGATAFSTGQKTRNSYIGLDSLGKPLETILEWAEKRDMATGMLVSSSVTHATPAAFAAHAESRAFYEEIALSMLQVPLDCVIGGGANTYEKQADGLYLRDSLKQRGYVVKNTFGSPKHLADTLRPFYQFTAEAEPATATSGRNYLPILAPKAARFLAKRSEKGSIFMVESSQIDWALHANDKTYLRNELRDFEELLESLLLHCAADGNTLLLVTGDHECGGLSINAGSRWADVKPAWATRVHTGTCVPVYAYGPGAQQFNGIYENTEIYWKIRRLLE